MEVREKVLFSGKIGASSGCEVECLEVVTRVCEESEGCQTHEPTFLPIMLSDQQKPLDDDLHFAIRWIFFEDDSVLEYRTL